MAQLARLEVQTQMKSPADKVYDIFMSKAYLMPKICPEMVKDVKIVKGNWDSVDSVRVWKYVAGTSETTSEMIEAVDEGNMTITHKALDGVATKHYKTFKPIVTVTANGEGSIVKWTLEFEKQDQDVPDPHKYLDFFSANDKAIDAYLLKQ